MDPYVHCALFTVTKIWKQLHCSLIGEWVNKMWNITHPQEKEILPFVTTWADLSEVSHTEKEKCRGFTYMGNPAKTNEQMK